MIRMTPALSGVGNSTGDGRIARLSASSVLFDSAIIGLWMPDFSSLSGTKLDLVKLELQIISSKISAVVDTLWKIRNLSITLWVGAIAVGLGNFTSQKTPIPPLLGLAAAIPVCFVVADVRNNRWYRRLAAREHEIHEYLTDGAVDESFVPFDASSVERALRNDDYLWETSFLRNLADPIPLSIYGGELLFGTLAFSLYCHQLWATASPIAALLAIVVISATARATKP